MQKYNLISLNGEFDYAAGLILQNSALENIKELDNNDYLILITHRPSITLGISAKKENILAPTELLKQQGINIYQTNRGGDVTYHGLGQLMGYPIIDVHRKKLSDYKTKLCKTLTDLLDGYGIKAEEGHGKLSGIWVGDRKIAAIGYETKKSYDGVKARVITMHGFALYVFDDMENFKYINPCGMPGMKLTSIEEQLGRKIDFEELKKRYAKHFEEVFEYEPFEKA